MAKFTEDQLSSYTKPPAGARLQQVLYTMSAPEISFTYL